MNWIGAPLLLDITHIRKSTMDEVKLNLSRTIAGGVFQDVFLMILICELMVSRVILI